MFVYALIVVVAFSCGFLAAALLAANRRQDTARAGDLLAEAVDTFTVGCRTSRDDADERVSVARSQVEGLRRALDVHDRLRSA
jgi:hypothetical protein